MATPDRSSSRHAPGAQVPVRAEQRRLQLALDRTQQNGGTGRSAERSALRYGCEVRDLAAGPLRLTYHLTNAPNDRASGCMDRAST